MRGKRRDTSKGTWTRIPFYVTRMGLKAIDVAIYMALASYVNDAQKCCPSYATIARRAGCSRRAAIRAMKHLQTAGLVHVQQRCDDGREYSTNEYTLTDPPGQSAGPGNT